jgi:hypothetical protein
LAGMVKRVKKGVPKMAILVILCKKPLTLGLGKSLFLPFLVF